MPGITPRINGGFLGKSILPSNVSASSNVFSAGMLSATKHFTLTKERFIPNLNSDPNGSNTFIGTYRVEVIAVGGGGGSGGAEDRWGGDFAGAGGGGGGTVAGDFLVTTGEVFEIGIGGGGGHGQNNSNNGPGGEGGFNGGGPGGNTTGDPQGDDQGAGGGGGGWTGIFKDFLPIIVAGGGAGGGGHGQPYTAGAPAVTAKTGLDNIDNTAGGGIQQRGGSGRMEGGSGTQFGTPVIWHGAGSGGGGGGFPGGAAQGMASGPYATYPPTGTSGGLSYYRTSKVSNARIWNGGFGRANNQGAFGGAQGGTANIFGNVYNFIVGNNGRGGNGKPTGTVQGGGGPFLGVDAQAGKPGNLVIRYLGPQKGRGGNVNFFDGYTYHHFSTNIYSRGGYQFTRSAGGANLGVYLFIA